MNWVSPAMIAKRYKLANRASVYRHAHALGLFPKRQRNVRAALEKIIERAGEVDVTAPAVVAAVQAYAKINAAGQWVDRSEHVDLNALFERMTVRGACPVHNAEKSAGPGKLYWDGCWPSDQYPLVDESGNGFSVAFIPGRLSDHNLLDDKYVYRLRMMSGSLSAAMEQGCWCELQGAYFANWKASKMVIPYGDVSALWWDAHFISLDYGFGKSSASAHLHVRTQDGKIKTIGEFVAPHLPAYEFAEEVVRRFVEPKTDKGNRRKIVAVYLDPSNFKHIGDGHTIANQINEILEPYDLGCLEASNDRIGGWQLMYQMLQTGQWKIADTCPKLIEAIPSRMHDEKKPGDVLKVPGDPLDDVADDARYGIYTFITTTEKPRELAIAEDCRQLAEQGDLTSAAIRYQQMVSESKVQFQPARLGRYRR